MRDYIDRLEERNKELSEQLAKLEREYLELNAKWRENLRDNGCANFVTADGLTCHLPAKDFASGFVTDGLGYYMPLPEVTRVCKPSVETSIQMLSEDVMPEITSRYKLRRYRLDHRASRYKESRAEGVMLVYREVETC